MKDILRTLLLTIRKLVSLSYGKSCSEAELLTTAGNKILFLLVIDSFQNGLNAVLSLCVHLRVKVEQRTKQKLKLKIAKMENFGAKEGFLAKEVV